MATPPGDLELFLRLLLHQSSRTLNGSTLSPSSNHFRKCTLLELSMNLMPFCMMSRKRNNVQKIMLLYRAKPTIPQSQTPCHSIPKQNVPEPREMNRAPASGPSWLRLLFPSFRFLMLHSLPYYNLPASWCEHLQSALFLGYLCSA